MELVRDTPLEVGWLVWSVQPPRPSLTVVVKATFDVVDGGKCTLAPKQERCTGDRHFDDDLEQSIRYPSDFAVLKKRGECLLAGTCHPPGGVPTGTTAVAFGVGKVKKALAVYGDRLWTGKLLGRGVGEPAPFTRMPLRWERAFGGPEHAANPLGRGLADVETPDGPARPLPNLEDPKALIAGMRDRPAPAGAFPIPATWAARRRLAGTYDTRWQRLRWPWLPEDFDFAFFHVAPADQQIDGYWSGDEEISLLHLRPERARVTSRLPGLAPRAFLEKPDAGLQEVRLSLDTITVDADANQALCVWRGLAEVGSEKLDDVRRLFVTHESIYDAKRSREQIAARLAAVLAGEEAEHAALQPEAVPDEGELEARDGAGAGTPGPTGGQRVPTDEELEREPAELGDARARLRAMGIDPDAHAAAEPPELPAVSLAEIGAELRKRFAQAELEVPPELERLGQDGPSPAEEAAAALAGQAPGTRSAEETRERVRARLAGGESLAGEDLSGADLHDLDLGGADLTRAILAGADLRGAKLDAATLDHAVLAGAEADGVSFRGASLRAADLTGLKGERAVFDGAALDGAVLSEGRLARASFEKASCAGTHLERASLPGATFAGARLDAADLSGAELEGARFDGASLVDATLHGVAAKGASFEGADLRKLRASEGAVLRGAVLRGCKASRSRWGRADLSRADLSRSELERADFTAAQLTEARLDECNLRSACFREATMAGASVLRSSALDACFEAADLSHADLRGSSLFGAQLWRARTDGARLELADLERTHLGGSR